MVRSRSIPPPKGTELAEQNYAELRANVPAEDRSPELYLLSSYLELREFDKLDALLQQLKTSAPADAEIEALYYSAAHYVRLKDDYLQAG